LNRAALYRASAYLVEGGTGPLPGGNAEQWDWEQASRLAAEYPVLLAGGLSPGNVKKLIERCRPAGIDISSGVETAPGKKDLAKVASLFKAISTVSIRSFSGQSVFASNLEKRLIIKQ
jgi:phosphoribosylanthranilate isomerase